jgi:hypothetical protein
MRISDWHWKPALEQVHFEIASAAAGADARREDVSAIYLRCKSLQSVLTLKVNAL